MVDTSMSSQKSNLNSLVTLKNSKILELVTRRPKLNTKYLKIRAI